MPKEKKEDLLQRRLEELRKEIAIGIKQAEQGKLAPLNVREIKRRVRERLRQARSRKNL